MKDNQQWAEISSPWADPSFLLSYLTLSTYPLGLFGLNVCGLGAFLFLPLVSWGAMVWTSHLSEPETQLRNVLRSCTMRAYQSWRCANMAREKIGHSGRELRRTLPRVPLCLRRNTLPGSRQWPAASTLSSCPETQPLCAHVCVSESLRVIRSLGFVSQVCCQLAEWPWASHVASGPQVALICQRRDLDETSEGLSRFPVPRVYEKAKVWDWPDGWNFSREKVLRER